ncbi:rubredoxin [Thiohalocapsa halophila]|uniref:Rubredoxin n=1 Tax=Thiohalocapsa halophila TaxID=69359 RepID=A0ABS1CGC8_9GAMM|nr:rubredoxin [Thiohalocapsa halophila]MBK1630763.1 rubredoxin [Thiohalocapsa halophila]
MNEDVTAGTRLECRICWHVYDPAEGDELGQVPPGTPFSDLPADWRCPQCDAAKELFLVLD